MDNNTDAKLKDNITRAAGISALRKIRTIVDDIDERDRNNRRRLLIYLATILILIVSVVLLTVNKAPSEPIIIDGVKTLQTRQD